jgi:hypothetical protein
MPARARSTRCKEGLLQRNRRRRSGLRRTYLQWHLAIGLSAMVVLRFSTSRGLAVSCVDQIRGRRARHRRTNDRGRSDACAVQLRVSEAALASRRQGGAVRVQCPPTVDLSGAKHAICTERWHGSSIGLDMHIDPVRGVSSVPLDAILDWDTLERTARETIDSSLRASGRVPDASVRCDRTILVATPPAVFYCAIVADGKSHKAQVTLKDGLGNVQFTTVP